MVDGDRVDRDSDATQELPLPGKAQAGGADPSRLASGTRFGPYEIRRFLGEGGMGRVFEAVHLESGHRLALKVLHPNAASISGSRERLLREGLLAASISHPNSLYVYGTEEINGTLVIAMELALHGTLKDRVQGSGPMSPAEAVDAVLQLIDGLQAAHTAGIIHRDIKPANCFVNLDGSIKIGDYGLAIAPQDPDLLRLTTDGSSGMTPAFSSPEQFRGQELDVRSDIYAVGATLYYLLTGRVPFEMANLPAQIAATLEQTPPSPRTIRPGIPKALCEVVLRCLEKKPTARFQNYSELKKNLLPFGSAATTPGKLGLRFAAYVVDFLLWSIPALAVTALLIPHELRALSDTFSGQSPSREFRNWSDAIFPLVAILGSGLLEWLWGTTPGKWLFRLRVSSADAGRPSPSQAFSRAGCFWLPVLLSAIAGRYVADSAMRTTLEALLFLGQPLLFVTARSRNGWCAIHERLTRTRVLGRPLGSQVAKFRVERVSADDGASRFKLGPYEVGVDPSAQPIGSVLLGYQKILHRRVWIRLLPPDSPPVSEARRNASRLGSPRWLQGHRDADLAWDAYEAADGMPLREAAGKGHPWGDVRIWLLDLAEEALLRTKEGILDPSATADYVWITSGGRAVLLDFPPPGGKALPDDRRTDGNLQVLLEESARIALGVSEPWDERSGPIWSGTPPPLHATRFLQNLRAKAFSSDELVVDELRSMKERNAVLRRRYRGLQYAVASLMTAGLLVPGVFLSVLWDARHPELALVEKSLGRLKKESHEDRNADDSKALELYLAGPLRQTVEEALAIPGTADSLSTVRNAAGHIEPDDRTRLKEILAAHPEVSPEEAAWATNQLERFLRDSRPDALTPYFYVRTAMESAGFSFVMLFPFALLCSLLFRGGLFCRLFGVTVVTSRGAEASRYRLSLRFLIAWSAILLSWILYLVNRFTQQGYSSELFAILGLAFILVNLWGLLSPERGLEDRLAGTFLVPK